MYDKTQIITTLRDEFERWDGMLSHLSEEQASNSILYANRSIKDDVGHLWGWQRISVARLQAAVSNTEPDLSWFPHEFEPESEDQLYDINEWFYELSANKTWSQVYADWKACFLRLIDLAQSIPESDLIQPDRYSWLGGYALIDVLHGTYDHHHNDHLKPLLTWLRANNVK